MFWKFYGVWTLLVLGQSFSFHGFSAPESVTRLLVLIFLAGQLLCHRWRPRAARAPGYAHYVLSSSARALVVEAFYMVSRPVFSCLIYTPAMPVGVLLKNTLIDWAFTAPAYLLIFSVCWKLLQRYRYSPAEYFFLFSAGQALGDGNAFFLANPVMLLFIPYVMLNYQACQFIPYLEVRALLPEAGRRRGRWLAPLVLIPCAYFLAGACIIGLGRHFGLH